MSHATFKSVTFLYRTQNIQWPTSNSSSCVRKADHWNSQLLWNLELSWHLPIWFAFHNSLCKPSLLATAEQMLWPLPSSSWVGELYIFFLAPDDLNSGHWLASGEPWAWVHIYKMSNARQRFLKTSNKYEQMKNSELLKTESFSDKIKRQDVYIKLYLREWIFIVPALYYFNKCNRADVCLSF